MRRATIAQLSLFLALAVALASRAEATQIWLKTTPGEVTVAMDGIELGKTSSYDGTFKPIDLPPGEHVFVFTRDGYTKDEQKINVAGSQLEIASTLRSLEDIKKEEEAKVRAEEEKRRLEEEKRREADARNQAAVKVETNVGKGGEVHWGTEFIGFTNDLGVAVKEGLKPGKARLVVKAKGYVTLSLPDVELKAGKINEIKANAELSEDGIREQEAARGGGQKKILWLGIAVGGFLLILVAIIILIVSGQRRHPEGYLQLAGQTGTGTGTDGAPGLFTTPANGAQAEDLGKLLETSDNLEVLIGKRILGDYLIEKKIGQGGMGAILLAKQESLERYTALKIILPKFSSNENVVKRFFREVKLTSRLEHPNIVTIYNFGKSREGILFVAMEFLDGANLDGVIRKGGPMQAERAVSIAAQIASALNEAHAKGVMHRDLKPSNVMLVKRGGMTDFAKVLDFGIAKSIEEQGDDEPQLTMSGQILGTPAYMSPEQCSGKPLDARTDIYSLGIIAFEMLAGKKPFMAESAIGFLQQHLMTPPPKLSSFLPAGQVPPQADAVFARVMAKHADQRYAQALDFARDLARAYGIHVNVPGI
jgi:serine/threonine-protein kinase